VIKPCLKKNTHFTRGIGLIEVIVGSAIIVVGIVALINAFTIYFKYALANDKNTQAAYLEEEGLEAMSYLRDYSWTSKIINLSTTTTYYLAWSSAASYWNTTTTPQYIDGTFLREIVLADVKRDASDKISTTSGTYDQNTKQVTATLKYFQGHGTTTQSMTTYISNLYGN
jgi:Tfp pilus assembly protein PilV